jgi:hypothetical protein
MRTDLPGARAAVGPVVGGLIALTVRWVPAPLRDRYDAEFRAELVCRRGGASWKQSAY